MIRLSQMGAPLAVALLTIVTAQHAVAEPISLEPQPGESRVPMEAFSGTCAGASVRVMGVTFYPKDTAQSIGTFGADFEAGRVRVSRPAQKPLPYREVTYSDLSDQNGVACVKNKRGNFLLIWKVCGGSMCGPFEFAVINVDTVKLLAPVSEKKTCDAECAMKITSSAIPMVVTSP